MALTKAASDILSFLFAKYKEDANAYYDIAPLVKESGPHAGDILEKFRQTEYIKPDIFISEGGNVIKCSIAAKGILEVDASYLEEKIRATLKGLGDVGGFGNVMKILGYDRNQHQLGFDLANEMQNRDYVKLLYASYTQNVISVEMLLPGKYIYDTL